MTSPEVIVLPDAEALAADVAARTAEVLSAAQQGRRAGVALTAGSIMEQVWGALATLVAADPVDWSDVDVFWADERFVPDGSDDRNDGPAKRILFDREPFSSAAHYPMPWLGGEYGDDLDAAAAGYAETLGDPSRVDVALIGVGPDGHCCSLFPDHPSSSDLSGLVIPVRESPKPPPLRLSFSFSALARVQRVWVVASGSGKADAVAAALAPDADRTHVPSAGARGAVETLWLVDQDAAAKLR